jgi:hypothetical protein
MLRKLARASAIGKKICMPKPIPIKGAIAGFAPLFLISLGPSVNNADVIVSRRLSVESNAWISHVPNEHVLLRSQERNGRDYDKRASQLR